MMVVDTCVIVDVSDCDPVFGERSARILEEYADGGLFIAPVSFVELAPAFLGDVNRENLFLFELGIELPSGFDTSDIAIAHAAWYSHILKKRDGKSPDARNVSGREVGHLGRLDRLDGEGPSLRRTQHMQQGHAPA